LEYASNRDAAQDAAANKHGFKVSNPLRVNRGALLGTFDLEAPSGMLFKAVMLFEKNGKRWIGFPSKEWTKQDGTKGVHVIEFVSRDVSNKFSAAVLPLAEGALL
jgi:hypothetical protein